MYIYPNWLSNLIPEGQAENGRRFRTMNKLTTKKQKSVCFGPSSYKGKSCTESRTKETKSTAETFIFTFQCI
jgi:hypothetical protein